MIKSYHNIVQMKRETRNEQRLDLSTIGYSLRI